MGFSGSPFSQAGSGTTRLPHPGSSQRTELVCAVVRASVVGDWSWQSFSKQIGDTSLYTTYCIASTSSTNRKKHTYELTRKKAISFVWSPPSHKHRDAYVDMLFAQYIVIACNRKLAIWWGPGWHTGPVVSSDPNWRGLKLNPHGWRRIIPEVNPQWYEERTAS